MPHFYLVTYSPLVASPAGRFASETHELFPFVDGSIRREPDLEHSRPGISGLCRTDRFAPRLAKDDVVAYMTQRRSFGNGVEQRLTAVLRVLRSFPNHESAAEWYESQGKEPPNNCLVPGNPPKPLDQSHEIFAASACAGDARTHKEWEAAYQQRAKDYPVYVVCKKLWCDLSWSAPNVLKEHLIDAFGKRPGTQTPGKLPLEGAIKLLKRLRIPAPLSDP